MISKNLILIIFLMGMTTSLVSSFGISSPYWEGNPLTMERGATETVNLSLQNMVEDKEVEIIAEITQGEDIASLETKDYTLAPGTTRDVSLIIKIPSDTPAGEVKKVQVNFRIISEDSSGISIETEMTREFEVIISETTKGNTDTNLNTIIGIIIVVAILSLILGLILRSKKGGNTKR